MPSNLVWGWSLHCNSMISYIFMRKDGLNRKRGHAIIGFNHGLPCYAKNMALGPQSRQKPRPTASVFVYLSPSGHVFNIAWQAMIIGFNHGVLGLAENPARGTGFWSQNTSGYDLGVLTEKNSPEGWVFSQAQHPMIKTYYSMFLHCNTTIIVFKLLAIENERFK